MTFAAYDLVKPIAKFYKRSIQKDPFSVSVKKWKRDRGDALLRTEYPLHSDSVVLDVGGYAGDFANELSEKFGCRIFVFEPMPRFYETCSNRFRSNPNITVLNYGLGARNEELELSDSDDGSSFCRDNSGKKSVKACIRDVESVWNDLGLDRVDLIKINIEGGEYPLLDRMLECDLANKVANFQIQFHDFIADAKSLRSQVRNRLAETHSEQWCYEFVWESWRQHNRTTRTVG